MPGKRICLTVLISIIPALLFGCNLFGRKSDKPEAAEIDRIEETPAEKEKKKLLKKIDKKWENAEAHYELGKLYQNDGLWSQAEYQYNITLGIDPVHRGAQAGRVKALKAVGDGSQASVSAEFYINQASSSAVSSLKLALAFQEQNLDQYALRCYEQALRLAPNSAKINRQIGYYYMSKGDKVRARDYLTRSFQLDSNQPEVARALGRLGVPVQIPRKTENNTRKLDRMVKKAEEE